ncbi:MAG: type I restriction-modification system subunit M N-terminal domain-containing protein [Candidatus Aenigmarchaeota archaeon]|nr:type I restriction-modification system subunit M N-terminal domain-containing protein [Candidatus Aenigmarchaeota archaeon]
MAKRKPNTGSQPGGAPAARGLEVGTLEAWLWEAACKIRGAVDAPKYKDCILPLIFMKQLSDVFDDELAGLVEEFGGAKSAAALVEGDHSLARFYVAEVVICKEYDLRMLCHAEGIISWEACG